MATPFSETSPTDSIGVRGADEQFLPAMGRYMDVVQFLVQVVLVLLVEGQNSLKEQE